MSNTLSTQLIQQRITDAGGREFRFRGNLYSQDSTFTLVDIILSVSSERWSECKRRRSIEISVSVCLCVCSCVEVGGCVSERWSERRARY